MWWGTIIVCLSSIGICDYDHAFWIGQAGNGVPEYYSCYYSGLAYLQMNAMDIAQHFTQNTHFVYEIICGIKA